MREARGGVLVVGGGFAGAYVARLLGKRGATIVSPENFMLYTPMLPGGGSGTLEPRHVVVPLRQMCPHAELLLARVTAIDEERRCRDDRAAGRRHRSRSTTRSSSSRSAPSRGRCPSPGSPSTDSASRISPTRFTSATTSCESWRPPTPSSTERRAAAHLTFVFVGAGYAGVEALAELSDLVADALRWYPRLRDSPQRWVLVDAAPKILPEIPTRLGEYAARELGAPRRRDPRRRRRSTSLAAGEATLSDGERIPTRHARLDGRRPRPPAAGRRSACRSTSAAASGSITFLRVEGRERRSGRSATAPPS